MENVSSSSARLLQLLFPAVPWHVFLQPPSFRTAEHLSLALANTYATSLGFGAEVL